MKNRQVDWLGITTIAMIIIVLLGFNVPGAAASAIKVSGIKSRYNKGSDISISYKVNNAKGVLEVSVSGAKNDIALMLLKGSKTENFRLKSSEKAFIPLNMGEGNYAFKVLMFIEGKTAIHLWETILSVKFDFEQAPYLSSSIIVNWTDEMALVEKAKSLIVQNDPGETALAICRFISERYTYNSSVKSQPAFYIPDLIKIYEGRTGICYDYATLCTAMCRAVGVPTQLVMGYSPYVGMNVYHAWCLVQINGKWLMVDPVYSMGRESIFLDPSNSLVVNQY